MIGEGCELRVAGCGFRVGSSTAHRAGLVQGDRVTQRFTEIFRDAQRVGSRLRGNDNGSYGMWVPAYAGMTSWIWLLLKGLKEGE